MRLLLAKAWIPVFVQIDLKKVLISLRDGTTPTPVSLIIKVGEGNLTYAEKRNIDYTLDRGNLDEVREGDQVPVEVRLDAVWEYITGGSGTGAVGTIEDFLKFRGAYAANVSTDSDVCRPNSIDIFLAYDPVCASASIPKEDITLADFRYEALDHDLRGGTIAMTGQCNVTQATSVRSS